MVPPAAILAAGLIILIFLYVIWRSSSVATGPSGGVTTPENPVINSPNLESAPTIPYTASTVVTPPTPALTKYIILSKDMTSESSPDYRTLQVAEIKVYTKDGMLDKSAFSDVSYGNGLSGSAPGQADYPAGNIVDGNQNTFTISNGAASTHTLTLTLSSPKEITSIEVFNRSGFMPERLRGTIVSLRNDTGKTMWISPVLTEQATVQVLNPAYTSGFLSGFTSKRVSRTMLPGFITTYYKK